MRAIKQTNQDVLKLALIAHKDEWKELIHILSDLLEDDPDNSIAECFHTILKQVVINGESNWNERSEIETREAPE